MSVCVPISAFNHHYNSIVVYISCLLSLFIEWSAVVLSIHHHTPLRLLTLTVLSEASSALGGRSRRHDALISVELAAQVAALLALSEAHATKLIDLVAATLGSGSLVDHSVAKLLLQLVLLELGVRKGVHVALRLLAQVVHVGVVVARQEIIGGAHGLIRIATALLPGAIVGLLLHIQLAFGDHLAGAGVVMMMSSELVGGEHLLRLGLLGDGHGEPAGVRVVRERVLQAVRRDRVGCPRRPLLLLLGSLGGGGLR